VARRRGYTATYAQYQRQVQREQAARERAQRQAIRLVALTASPMTLGLSWAARSSFSSCAPERTVTSLERFSFLGRKSIGSS
jgi:hypothetical protein